MCCRGYVFCCVRDLRLATLVIAVISLLANITELAFVSWFFDFGIHRCKDPHPSDTRDDLTVLMFIIVTSSTAILLNVVLMVGAVRRRHGMVQCWLYGYFLLQFTVLFCYYFFILSGLPTLLVSFIISAVIVYFWLVVHRFDLQLQQGRMRAVCINCNPSTLTSYDLESSQQLPSFDNNEKVLGTLDLPPPYTRNP